MYPSMRAVIPTEDEEQQALFEWAQYRKGRFPELETLYHIPNEGKRSAQTGARLKSMGLCAGVPDICLPVARGGYASLYIELKRIKGGKLSENQKEWLQKLNKWGCLAVRCDGWEQAAKVIETYLKGEISANGKTQVD